MAENNGVRIDALFIGYENQENLGLRSISAFLAEHGYRTLIIPFLLRNSDEILSIIRASSPRLVGFSLIFQYSLVEFKDLMGYLRANGINAHFTAGGHYPSLRPEKTLEILPELNSIVRFEGELTLLELLDNIDRFDHWSRIQGIAYRNGSETVITPPRPLITDLNILPHVYRDKPKMSGYNVRIASMTASRGCLYNCSFCSIHKFYSSAPGPLRRSRNPESVVQEMLGLYNDSGIQMFIFQDDDFAAKTHSQLEWLRTFLKLLSGEGLTGKIKWKISCRVDDLEPDILKHMMDCGLIAVYLGVESGSEQGLRTMNKRVSVKQNLHAVNLLKNFGLALAIGFMLFDPSSSIASIRDNIDFLHEVGMDGYFPINFCKLLPYAGTRIETQLLKAGRLKGTQSDPDYDFLDPQMDSFAYLVQRIFTKRNFSPEGIVMKLQTADFDYKVSTSLGIDIFHDSYCSNLRQMIAESNAQALSTLDILFRNVLIEKNEMSTAGQSVLLDCAEQEWRCEIDIEARLKTLQHMAQTRI